MSGPQAPIGVNILVDDAHRGSIEQVRDALTAAGLQDGQVLTASGVIIGSVAPDLLSTLDAVDGVAAVEPSRDIQLPPPDAPVQ